MISEDSLKLINSTVYTFGEFSLETENLLLQRNSEVVPLAPKALEVLLALVESNGKLITKQEILEKVWADTFVEEANLTHHISALRKALGEDKNGRKFIETIPRKGYRFVAEVKDQANSEGAEIVINQRDSVKVFEETTIQTDDLPDRAKIIKEPKAINAARKNPLRFIWIFAAVLLIGAAAIFAYRNFGSATTSQPPEISFKRLTPDMDASAPSVSPDGASIVFVRAENGRQSLWRKQIASGETAQLTPAVSMLDEGIGVTRFSPDGRWIYYTHIFANDQEKTLSIFRVPAGGGTAQKILSGLQNDFSISPDGKQIAYTFDWRQVIVADIETGNKRIAAERDGVKETILTEQNSPAWSPDGTRLIYPVWIITDGRYVQQLIELNLTTGAEKQIQFKEDFGVSQIECLADESGLIVMHNGQIWRFDYRTGAAKRLSNETDRFSVLRLSADSRILIAEQNLGQYNIWTAPADNIEKRRQISIGAAAKHGEFGLAWMPDGKIVYSSTESGAKDLWLMNEQGGERRNLTAGSKGLNIKPSPTADGRYIVFNSTRSGTNQIWRMDADGGNPVQISKAAETFEYTLSPESDVYYVTFSADEKKYQIYKVGVAGGAEPVRISDGYYSERVPQFSPDGRWILFFGGETSDDKPRLGIVERASGKIVRYFDNGFDIRGWMPDSKAVVDTMAQGQQLWRQPIDGSAAEKIYDLSPLKIQRWDFSTDGKQVVFSLGNSTNEIVEIQNFAEGVK